MSNSNPIANICNGIILNTLNNTFGINYNDNNTLQIIASIVKAFMDIQTGKPVEVVLPNDTRCFVIGDIHGDKESLDMILKFIAKFSNAYPSKMVFLGDYIDRGPYSIEVLVVLMSLKVMYGDNVVLLRGNHECEKMDEYGFEQQCIGKVGCDVYNLIMKSFDFFPISCMIKDRVYMVHGGIPMNLVEFDRQLSMKLPVNVTAEGTSQLYMALWNDPMDSSEYMGNIMADSRRGEGVYTFGEVVTTAFLTRKKVGCIIRAHEVTYRLDEITPDKKVTTIFSSVNYWKYTESSKNMAYIMFCNDKPVEYNGNNMIFARIAFNSIVKDIQNAYAKMDMTSSNPIQLIARMAELNKAMEEANESTIAKEDAKGLENTRQAIRNDIKIDDNRADNKREDEITDFNKLLDNITRYNESQRRPSFQQDAISQSGSRNIDSNGDITYNESAIKQMSALLSKDIDDSMDIDDNDM